MGYVLAGLAAGNQQGTLAVMIYMTGYIFMSAGTFAIILLHVAMVSHQQKLLICKDFHAPIPC